MRGAVLGFAYLKMQFDRGIVKSLGPHGPFVSAR